MSTPTSEAMDTLFALEPHVAGNWGPETVVLNREALEAGLETVPQISVLDYRFDVWLGDELLQGNACYLATDSLAKRLQLGALSGMSFQAVKVSVSELFEDAFPQVRLPTFQRLIPEGTVDLRNGFDLVRWSGDDICWGSRIDYVKPSAFELAVDSPPPPYSLVVTARSLEILKQHCLRHCEIHEVRPP